MKIRAKHKQTGRSVILDYKTINEAIAKNSTCCTDFEAIV
jgi:hypothetical protein